ncbi:hypothetical protein ES703_06066 [subsurface metagenome]|jgi:uncharacterized protein YeaO (DUF488 family)
MGIRIDCYLAKLKEFKSKYPNAHFEVITNTSKSILAPSKELLIDAGIFKKPNGTKNPKMDFKEYKIRFMAEIYLNLKACSKLLDLKNLAEEKTVFLVCYCKNPEFCHRSIIKDMIERI